MTTKNNLLIKQNNELNININNLTYGKDELLKKYEDNINIKKTNIELESKIGKIL
jgi:hypothetical protein